MTEPMLCLPAPRGVAIKAAPTERCRKCDRRKVGGKCPACGRPATINDENREEILQKLERYFRIDCTDEEACSQAGIAPTIYYNELKANAQFRERIEAAQALPFVLMKQTVMHAVKNKDANAALKWLKNRQNSRYNEKIIEEQHVKEDPAATLLAKVMGVETEPEKA